MNSKVVFEKPEVVDFNQELINKKTKQKGIRINLIVIFFFLTVFVKKFFLKQFVNKLVSNLICSLMDNENTSITKICIMYVNAICIIYLIIY